MFKIGKLELKRLSMLCFLNPSPAHFCRMASELQCFIYSVTLHVCFYDESAFPALFCAIVLPVSCVPASLSIKEYYVVAACSSPWCSYYQLRFYPHTKSDIVTTTNCSFRRIEENLDQDVN